MHESGQEHTTRASAGRRMRILARLVDVPDDALFGRLGEVCAAETGTSGAGIMVVVRDAPRLSLAATNATGALIERLQRELGEGPCVDAHDRQVPVIEPDLAAAPPDRSNTMRTTTFTAYSWQLG